MTPAAPAAARAPARAAAPTAATTPSTGPRRPAARSPGRAGAGIRAATAARSPSSSPRRATARDNVRRRTPRRQPRSTRLGRTIRKHREGILAARRLKLTNARAEALNNKAKLIVRRAYGFHSRQRRTRARSPRLRADHTHTPTRTLVRMTSPTFMPGEPVFLAGCAVCSDAPPPALGGCWVSKLSDFPGGAACASPRH